MCLAPVPRQSSHLTELHAGGPPNGSTSLTSTTPAHDTHFAIQTLSRFGLAYLLASSGTLKDTWISVCAPAGEKGPEPDVEDIELLGDDYRKKWTVQRILGQAKQDSALNDAAAVVSVASSSSFRLEDSSARLGRSVPLEATLTPSRRLPLAMVGQQFTRHFPQLRAVHLFPGFVYT